MGWSYGLQYRVYIVRVLLMSKWATTPPSFLNVVNNVLLYADLGFEKMRRLLDVGKYLQ